MRLFPDARISDRHGTVMKWRDGIVVFPLYHPAAGLRSGRLKQALQEDFAKLPQAVIAALDASRESPAHDAPPNPNGGASDDGDDDRQTSFF
jgi:DNA polymerase